MTVSCGPKEYYFRWCPHIPWEWAIFCVSGPLLWLSLYVLGTQVSCQNRLNQSRCRLRGRNYMSLRNHALDRDPYSSMGMGTFAQAYFLSFTKCIGQAHSPAAAGELCAMHPCAVILQWAGTRPLKSPLCHCSQRTNEPKEPYIGWGPISLYGNGHFWGDVCQPIVI